MRLITFTLAATLACAPLVLGTLVGLVPVSVVGGVSLAHVLARCPWEEIRRMSRRPWRETLPLAAAAAAFVAVDSSIAVMVALLLSAGVLFRERRRWTQGVSQPGAGRTH